MRFKHFISYTTRHALQNTWTMQINDTYNIVIALILLNCVTTITLCWLCTFVYKLNVRLSVLRMQHSVHIKYVKKEIEDITFITNKSAEILLELCCSNGWQLSSAESFQLFSQLSSQTLSGLDFSVMTPAHNDVTENT